MKTLLLAFVLLLAPTGSAIAQTTFPLDPSQWLLDPQQVDQGTPFTKKGTLAFWFPRYPDNPNYTGYLLLPWTQALSGSTFNATVQVITFPANPDVLVRFIPAYNGGCTSPGKVFIFFQTNTLYNGIEGTQWWSNLDAWPIADTGTATVTISVDLNDMSRWYSVYGHSATGFPGEFANAKAHPTYVGLTFGGSCANAHGLQTRKGDAQFRLHSLSVN